VKPVGRPQPRGSDPRATVLASRMSPAQCVAIALCCAIQLIDGYDTIAVTFAMPGIGSDWAIGKSMLGALFSTGIIGMAGGCIVLGPLADSLGRRPMAIASLALMTASMTLSALAPNFTLLMVCRLSTGAGIGALISVAYPLSFEYSSLRARPITLALMVICFPLGGAIGGYIASDLIATLGWRAAFLPGIVFPAVVILLCLKWLPEPLGLLIERPRTSSLDRVNKYLAAVGQPPVDRLPPPDRPGQTSVRRVLGKEFRRTTFYLSAIYCLYALSAYFLLAWLPQMVTDMGFTPAVAATVSVAASAGGALGASVTGLAIRRWGVLPVMTTLLLGMGAAIALISKAPADIVLLRILGAAAGVFVFGPIVGINLLIAEEYPVEVRATGTGFILGLSRWAAALGPLVGGIMIASSLGAVGSCALMGLVACLSAGLLVFYGVRHRHAQPDVARVEAA